MEENEIQSLKTYIQQFIDIPDDQIVSFSKLTKKETIKKGDYFSTPEKPHPFVGFIVKGLFRIFMIDNEGNEIVLAFAGENNILTAYGSIISNQFLPNFIQAIENSEIYIISREILIGLWENDIKWKELLHKQAESANLASRKRYISILTDDAKTRYLNFLNDYEPFVNRIKQADVASFLGISPETLSRIRSSPLKI